MKAPLAPLELNPKFLVLTQQTFCTMKVIFTFGTENSGEWRKLYCALCFEKISLKKVGAKSLFPLKSVRIRSYSSPDFPTFGLNTERYSVFLRIQSKCGKIRTRIIRNRNTFYAVCTLWAGIFRANGLFYYLLYDCETSILKGNSWTVM